MIYLFSDNHVSTSILIYVSQIYTWCSSLTSSDDSTTTAYWYSSSSCSSDNVTKRTYKKWLQPTYSWITSKTTAILTKLTTSVIITKRQNKQTNKLFRKINNLWILKWAGIHKGISTSFSNFVEAWGLRLQNRWRLRHPLLIGGAATSVLESGSEKETIS